MPLSLIPQVFYDLIARVIPGFIVIMMWYLTILGPNKAVNAFLTVSSQPDQSIFNFWSFAALLTVSYLIGLILDELWRSTFRRIKSKKRRLAQAEHIDWCIAQNDQIRKCLGQPALGLEGQDLPPVHVMHDHLRLHSESEAYRLLKLQAEARLCEALFAGLLLLPAINALFWYRDFKWLVLDRMALELALIVALVTFWKASDRFEQFYTGGTCTSWLLRSFPIEPLKPAQAHLRRSGDAADE